jgi:predicted RNase H-like nuclease (RuvC/YqgF family)
MVPHRSPGDPLFAATMSDPEFTSPQPLVLRVEISAEQANALTPLFEGHAAAPVIRAPAPISEAAVDARVLELTERETELQQREAEFEADVQFREDRIERWRTELEELEQTLDRRERDLVSYVDQLQGAMSTVHDDAWWSRPAGGDGGVR